MKGPDFKGPEDKNESYFCYDQPIYSVAAGKVVAMSDGPAEIRAALGRYAVPIDFNNAAGNHLVVEIAPHRYALYAHMRPGTVQVKLGEHVRVGQILGHVGNTGSSAEPHLHMHIDDQPSVSRRQRRALRIHRRRSERAGSSRRQFAERDPSRPDRGAHPFKNDFIRPRMPR